MSPRIVLQGPLSAALLALATLASCSADSSDLAAERSSLTTSAMDLVSTSTCLLQNGKLRQCVIPSNTVAALPFETPVPLRTVATRTKSGTCSTPYNVAVTVTLDDGTSGTLYYLNQERLELRRPGGARAASVTVADGSPTATKLLTVSGNCLVSLSLSINEPDVDSRSEAEAIIAAIEAELTAKQAERDRYEELLTFSAAYDFMHSLAQSFYGELTHEGMERLRTAALAARPGLVIAFDSCSEISGDDSDHLFELYEALVVLGDPAAWKHADGTTKTFAEVLGPNAAAVYQTVTLLEAQASPGLQTQYEAALQSATSEVQLLEANLALAKSQLATWLAD